MTGKLKGEESSTRWMDTVVAPANMPLESQDRMFWRNIVWHQTAPNDKTAV